MEITNRRSEFVEVNGIRLHYLDWGGEGPVMIFLTGMGASAYIFGDFAPRFTDRFHVLALTRRGQGDSDYPESGYDADTLTEDIRGFMDCLGIGTAVLVGHSLAGVELTHFAATYPDRVEKTVYLDALDDRRGIPAIFEQNPLRDVELEKEESPPPRTLEAYIAGIKRDIPAFAEVWSEVWDEEFFHGTAVNEDGVYIDKMPEFIDRLMNENLIQAYEPKRVAAKIPTLNIVARKTPRLADGYTEEQKAAFDQFLQTIQLPYFDVLITDFQERFPHAKTIVIPDGHHYCFMAQAELVYGEMEKFLCG